MSSSLAAPEFGPHWLYADQDRVACRDDGGIFAVISKPADDWLLLRAMWSRSLARFFFI
jgi:hypothetical protein